MKSHKNENETLLAVFFDLKIPINCQHIKTSIKICSFSNTTFLPILRKYLRKKQKARTVRRGATYSGNKGVVKNASNAQR